MFSEDTASKTPAITSETLLRTRKCVTGQKQPETKKSYEPYL